MNNIDHPNHSLDEEGRFETDFYGYLAHKSNDSRYSIAMDYLRKRFPDAPYALLDVGCGNGALSLHAPSNCEYTGIDHSELAIQECRRVRSRGSFFARDVFSAVEQFREERKVFEAIVFCGFFFHVVDKDSLGQKNDTLVLQECIRHILAPNGCVIIIAPFAYRDAAGYALCRQAEWKLASVAKVTDPLNLKTKFQAMTLQIGLEKVVESQKTQPDWFVSAHDMVCENRFSGHYLASWTLALDP